MTLTDPTSELDIAVIGMSGRFPGARDVRELWSNLVRGIESISFFSKEEIEVSVIDPDFLAHPNLVADPNYVRARGILEGIELFDAAFFGYSPAEAEIIDPQQRFFLECAWAALEDAGYDSERYCGRIGVYAGASMNTYFLSNVYPNPHKIVAAGALQTALGNDKDGLTTRVAYRLNLRGPALTIQTSSSTSLVAVAVACRELLAFQCDMAMAGGVSINSPQKTGYLYQEGGISSRDGHCRAFSAGSDGFVSGHGVGLVVLKRLAEALADGDHIYAVIKATAINNDGCAKVSYSAPSIDGQAAVIAETHALAGIDPRTITYVEAHGTGTAIGDPIEVAALTQAFRRGTDEQGFCAIGSIKTNIGHLDTAAGVAGLIKACLALEHRQIPPSLNFESPNPVIPFDDSPFYVNTRLVDWPGPATRRAGVSSFGMGGTNAHVLLEEAPSAEPSRPSRPEQLLLLSAKSAPALDQVTVALARHLEAAADLDLADVAYTLQVGRRVFSHRRMLVCDSLEDAAYALGSLDPERVLSVTREPGDRPVALLFPGQGSQYVGMARDLWEYEPVFREALDRCADLLRPHLGEDLRARLYPTAGSAADPATLDETWLAQPVLFAVEYALAELWRSWGVRAQAMIGHSLGEYVAACLAGVLALEDALALVAARGRLMQEMPRGAMLAVPLSEPEVVLLLGDALSLAAINGPALCVVSGPEEAVADLDRRLRGEGLECRRLHTSHAFHSRMMEPVLRPFAEEVRRVRLGAPRLPFLSNVTGTWITAAEATDPDYWVRHLRQPVRFTEGIGRLLEERDLVLLEVGSGKALTNLARRHPTWTPGRQALSSLRHPQDSRSDSSFLLATLGRLWLAGVGIDWEGFSAGERRCRVPLPTYPFQGKRHWIDPRPLTLFADPPETRRDAPGAEALPPSDAHHRPDLPLFYAAPRDETERAIAAVWQELLGIREPGVHEDFFELGGHSLLATQLLSRLRDRFRVEVPVRGFFESPTIAGLATMLRPTGAARLQAVLPRRDRGSHPLSFAQQRLWFLDRLEPGNPSYNIATAVRLSGPLRQQALQRSLAEVVRRHEALRARFVEQEGRPLQLVTPPGEPNDLLPVVDLQGLPMAARESMARQLARAEARRPFDLARGPLLRGVLFQLEPRERVLLLAMHHIVSDGWSIGVLVREMSALYEAFAGDLSSPLPELPLQYADFAEWQREWLQGEVIEAQLSYWERQLAGSPTVLELPTDRPRPLRRSGRGARLPLELPARCVATLQGACQREGTTLFMTLLAAFGALLSRHSGQRDLLIGTPIANRNHSEIEGLIGFFVNPLVLRLDLRGDPTFLELQERVRGAAIAAYANQDLPFETLVERLQPARELSHAPFFQVLCVLQEAPLDTLELGSLTLCPLDVETGTSKFDLSLELLSSPRGLAGALEYDSDLFDSTTVHRLLRRFESLLAGIAAHPGLRLSELPLLPDPERHQILIEWHDTRTDFGVDLLVHEVVAAQARRAPEAVAVVFAGEELSYQELEHQTNRLARLLRRLGVEPEVRVGICLERSLEMVVSLLAVLKAGGAYVPLEPNDPQERLALVLEDACPGLVLTLSQWRERLPANRLSVLCLDAEAALISAESPQALASGAHGEGLAYVIFTSGSTGRPKGAMNSHRALRNRLLWMQSIHPLTPEDRVLQKTPFTFDVSVWEFLWPLMTGARLVVARPGGHRDNVYLIGLIESERVTTVHFVPSMLQAFVDELVPGGCSSLRRVVCSGEALPFALLQRFAARSQAELCNLYGPTETAIEVTSWVYHRSDPTGRVPIGRPIANLEAHLLDLRMEPVPIGVTGEIYLGGIGLGRGYLGRPALTAERFLPHPFAAEPGARLYRTGDLAHHLPDGTLEYLGRTDQQVKIRGFRIELGEVEEALTGHPEVREAVVVAQSAGTGEARLVAYVIPASPLSPTLGELRRHLAEKLPEYMVPSCFVTLEELPLTASGKIDRRSLPAPEQSSLGSGKALRSPRDEVELRLVRLFEEVLEVSPLGVDDDFFERGGHSFLAMRLLSRIRTELGSTLPVFTLFQSPTVEQLAVLLRGEAAAPPRSPLVAIQPSGEGLPFVCVHPGAGNVFGYFELARLLGAGRPFWGLQVPDLTEGEEPPASIEGMAARYIAALRTVRPLGPWLLGGWSMGGFVAYEMARQLREAGDEVALLVLIDCAPPSSCPVSPLEETVFLAGLARDLAGLAGIETPLSEEDFERLEPERRVRALLDLAESAGLLPPGVGYSEIERLLAVFRRNVDAMLAYRPQPWEGRLVYFRAAEELPEGDGDPTSGWATLANGGAEVHILPGNHYTLLRAPHVEALARELAACWAAGD